MAQRTIIPNGSEELTVLGIYFREIGEIPLLTQEEEKTSGRIVRRARRAKELLNQAKLRKNPTLVSILTRA